MGLTEHQAVNQILGDSRSFSRDAFVNTTYSDDYIVRGYAYTLAKVQTLGSSATINFALTPTAEGFFLFVPPLSVVSQDEYVQIKVYEGGDYSGGTAITPINRNRNSSNTFQSSLTTGATGTDKGTLLITHAAFASSGPAGSSVPDTGGGSDSLILNSSKKYLVEIVNQVASATDVEIDVTLYEIPSSGV